MSTSNMKVGTVMFLSKYHWIKKIGDHCYMATVVNCVGGALEHRAETKEICIEWADKKNEKFEILGRVLESELEADYNRDYLDAQRNGWTR